MDVCSKPLRHIFPLQIESATIALNGLADGSIAILPVNGINGFHQCLLPAPVDGVEEVLLTGMVGLNLPQDNASFFEVKRHVGAIGSAVSHRFRVFGP